MPWTPTTFWALWLVRAVEMLARLGTAARSRWSGASIDRAALLRWIAKSPMPELAVKAVVGQLITSSGPFFTRHRGDDLVVPGTTTRHLGFSPLLAARFRPFRLAPWLTLPWSAPFLLSLNNTLILPLEHAFFSLSMYCPSARNVSLVRGSCRLTYGFTLPYVRVCKEKINSLH